MASSSGPGIFEWLLIGGAAYLAWNWWTSQSSTPAATTATTGNTAGTTTTTSPPNVAYVPPTLVQQLQALAGASVTQLNADQWNYYYTSPTPQGLNNPSPSNFNSVFFPNGRPTTGTAEPTMTAAQYVSALGLSGYGFPFRVQRGRGFGQVITMHDLRRAGRNY